MNETDTLAQSEMGAEDTSDMFQQQQGGGAYQKRNLLLYSSVLLQGKNTSQLESRNLTPPRPDYHTCVYSFIAPSPLLIGHIGYLHKHVVLFFFFKLNGQCHVG